MLSAFDLAPGPGLARSPHHPADWTVSAPVVTFRAAADLRPGWHRLTVRGRTPARPAVRKRAELLADGRRVEAFEWNDRLRETLLVKLAEPAREITLTLTHAAGPLRLDRFELRPVSPARAAVRAVRLKLKLLADYQCVWPVVARGGRLLARGRVREFGRKLLNGISDARTMRIEVKRANEVSASWWRRRGPSPEEMQALRAEADAVPGSPTVLVLVPADPTRTHHARQTLLSVFRQAYPHWQAALPWAGADVPDELRSLLKWDDRLRIVTGPTLAEAVRRAVAETPCERLLVLPPDRELVEHGLLRFVQAAAGPVACAAADGFRPAVLPVADVRAKSFPEDGVSAVVRWAGEQVPADAATVAESLTVPFGGRHQQTAAKRVPAGRLTLAADVRGLTGWDHVAFQALRGLHSLGLDVRKHPAARVYPDLLPPGVSPAEAARTGDPQLVIAPPFLVGRFDVDSASAVYTMWEADRIPPEQAATLNRARVVLVPSRWGADCFRASGVTAPIEVVPLGYDPLVFRPGPVRLPSPGSVGEGLGVRGLKPSPGPNPEAPGRNPLTPNPSPAEPGEGSRIVFGTAGALSAGGLRKNTRRVVELFRRAFPTEPDVRLRVKITPDCPPFDIPDDPRIEVLRAALPAAELAGWNRSLAAYVNASFAEGFGFHLLEAMACGRPLISTAYSGPTEFFDASVGYVVPHRLIEADNAVYAGRWADPDDEALIAAMRRVYADRAEADRLGEAAAARARRFTWRDWGRKLVAVLRQYELMEDRACPSPCSRTC